MEKGRVIIVGNSPNILQHKNGHLIDKYNTVIRLGNTNDKYCIHIGVKTDILCTRWVRCPHIDTNIRTFWFPYPPQKFEPENASIAGVKMVYMTPDTFTDIWERLKIGKMGSIPTLGLGSIRMALDIFKDDIVDITGFTLDIFDTYFSKGEYWDINCKRDNERHNLVGEALEIKRLLRNNRIRYKYF